MDFGGTTKDPHAAQVDVARSLDVISLQMSERGKGVVVGVVVVPGEAVGVDEDGVRGEGVVAVDDMIAGCQRELREGRIKGTCVR